MTIVIQWINMEYPCKKNHSYTDMTKWTNLIMWNRIYVRPSFTFAGGGRRGLSQERIYEDDQMVIFVKNSFSYSRSKLCKLKVCENQIQHSFSRQMNPLKKWQKNLALYMLMQRKWHVNMRSSHKINTFDLYAQ